MYINSENFLKPSKVKEFGKIYHENKLYPD